MLFVLKNVWLSEKRPPTGRRGGLVLLPPCPRFPVVVLFVASGCSEPRRSNADAYERWVCPDARGAFLRLELALNGLQLWTGGVGGEKHVSSLLGGKGVSLSDYSPVDPKDRLCLE